MTRYFLHLKDDVDEMLDPDGVELADLEAVRACVMKSARDVIAGDVHRGVVDFRYRIDAETEDGQVVYSLPFANAVNIIPGLGRGLA